MRKQRINLKSIFARMTVSVTELILCDFMLSISPGGCVVRDLCDIGLPRTCVSDGRSSSRPLTNLDSLPVSSAGDVLLAISPALADLCW